MLKFEYIEELVVSENLIFMLNQLGSQGWQVVNISDKNNTNELGYKALNVIFMRELRP